MVDQMVNRPAKQAGDPVTTDFVTTYFPMHALTFSNNNHHHHHSNGLETT